MAATVKNPAMKAKLPFIPNDIMANIFKRLPVRSLIQFQCVSKDWENLIKNLIKIPSFIQDHLHYSSYQNPSLLLEQYHARFSGIRLSVLDCDMRVSKTQQLPSIHSSFNCEVVGSSNGLVCLKMVENGTYPHPILIWNPTTREVRKVCPRTIIDSELMDYLGFGFSPLDNDYKIVRINLYHPFNIVAVEVYSLNSRSWKEIDFGDHRNVLNITPRNVTINGVMFWYTMWRDDFPMILSIDLSKQVCTLITSMPDIEYHARECLIEYDNKLAVVARMRGDDGFDHSVYLWVMEEDTCASGDPKRWKWTKIYTSRPTPCDDLYPMTIWRDEIVLLPYRQIENDGQTSILYLLNLATNEFKKLAVRAYSYNFDQRMKGRPFPCRTTEMEIDVFNYVESLVSVGFINSEEL